MTGDLSKTLAALKENLRSQQQAMLADDLAAIQFHTSQQQGLLGELNSLLQNLAVTDIDDCTRAEFRAVHDLLVTNQLLARQSLDFSRRVLTVAGLSGGYRPDGTTDAPGAGMLDKRA